MCVCVCAYVRVCVHMCACMCLSVCSVCQPSGDLATSTLCSVFDEQPIPYPKRECIADEDNKDDKNDAAKEQVCNNVELHIHAACPLCYYRRMNQRSLPGRGSNSALITILQLIKECIKDCKTKQNYSV